MFADLWPDVPVDEVPITSVTNGVHAGTWVSPEMADLLDPPRAARVARGRAPSDWARIDDVARRRAVAGPRAGPRAAGGLRAAAACASRCWPRASRLSDVAWTDEVLDPKALTIGFARRFATYKRATLLLSQPDRLQALLLSPDRPVQFVFAGKAHPADDAGQGDDPADRARSPPTPSVRHRFVFVDDYDIAVARALLPGRRRVAEQPAAAAGGVRHERA